MRKILHNKKKEHRLNGTTKGKLGTPLGILDRNNEELVIGDRVRYDEYIGIILYNHHLNEYDLMLEYSKWYGDDIYNVDSYGKCIKIPMDNGAKLELERLEAFKWQKV